MNTDRFNGCGTSVAIVDWTDQNWGKLIQHNPSTIYKQHPCSFNITALHNMMILSRGIHFISKFQKEQSMYQKYFYDEL